MLEYRKYPDIFHNHSIKTIRKNKQLVIVTFFYCDENHNLSLNQFFTHLNWLKSTSNAQMFSFSGHLPMATSVLYAARAGYTLFPLNWRRRLWAVFEPGDRNLNRCIILDTTAGRDSLQRHEARFAKLRRPWHSCVFWPGCQGSRPRRDSGGTNGTALQAGRFISERRQLSDSVYDSSPH